MKKEISICWFRRDLRLEDNAALYHALKGPYPVLPLFIFDKKILEKLESPEDARVTFIHKTISELDGKLKHLGSGIVTKYGTPEDVWREILNEYDVKALYFNHDYEPYARERDDALMEFMRSESISCHHFKDQVIFEKNEVVKPDGRPYTVFTPYFKQWQQKLNAFYHKPYPVGSYTGNLLKHQVPSVISLETIGFRRSAQHIPSAEFEEKLENYEALRDLPGADATTRIGIHLRFGTVSIRSAVSEAIKQKAHKWLSELAWRDFYMMILWHFPHTASRSFKPAYDNIIWRNDEKEFRAWQEGKTGYPLVDAGMRQLNQTGFMHNRVRMVAASFLSKHLLIDWRWGEAYFADRLLDYEMSSNIGGWQWACGSGNDAAPYFRVFNPDLQAKKFDPEQQYINRWLPEYKQKKHVQPIVEHAFARERALSAFKKALRD